MNDTTKKVTLSLHYNNFVVLIDSKNIHEKLRLMCKLFGDDIISILASESAYSIEYIISIKNMLCSIHSDISDVFSEKVLKNVFEEKILEKEKNLPEEKNKKYLAIYITLVNDSNYKKYAEYIKSYIFSSDNKLIHYEFDSLGFLEDYRPEKFRYYLFYKIFFAFKQNHLYKILSEYQIYSDRYRSVIKDVIMDYYKTTKANIDTDCIRRKFSIKEYFLFQYKAKGKGEKKLMIMINQ